MIKDKVFSAKITIYRNYLRGCKNCAEPVATLPEMELLPLLKRYYENNGAFIYEINKYEL